jgi:hemerythrin-like domain-containing protein
MKITDALVAEHTIFLSVFDQIERVLPSLTSLSEVRTMASVVEGLLQGHSSRETDLAYIALDHVLEHKGELDRMHHEHAELDARLKSIQAATNCTEARRLLKATLGSSREHFRLEEKVLFPLLERSLKTETLRELGRTWLEREAASR